MPEETLFCDLWNQLNNASNAAIEDALETNPSGCIELDNYDKNGNCVMSGSYTEGPTPAPTYTISCEYEDHPANATEVILT